MDPITLLERQNFNQTGQEATQDERPSSGWASLGEALGSQGGAVQGAQAYANGMRVGAQTADALAQARQRVNDAEQGNTAGDLIEKNGTALGLKPEEAALLATYARKGAQPNVLAETAQGFQKLRATGTLGDQFADPAAREAAAAQLAPGAFAPKAEGSLGSVFQPFAPAAAGGGLTGATSVSPLQTQVAQSEIARNNAAVTNAGTNQEKAANTGLKTGMRWVHQDPNDPNSTVALDSHGKGIQEPDPNIAPKGEGAINSRYHQVVLQAANGVSREADNLAHMGLTTSTGAISGTPGHGLLGVATDNLGKALSGEDQRQYVSTMTNVGRYLSMIENAGRMPPGSMTGQLDQAIKNAPADTEGARLYNAALVRQIVESGQDTIHASSASKEIKDGYDAAVSKVQKAIPFTPNDIIDFERAGKGTNLQQFLKSRQSGGGGSPAAAPAATGKPIDLGNGWSVVQH